MRAWIILVAIVTLEIVAVAQQVKAPEPPKYQPTEVQSLRLKVAYDDARLAQRDAQDAQTKFQQSLQALSDAADKIKQENNWPSTVQFNMDSLSFAEAPKPTPSPTIPATPEKKP